MQPLKNDLPRCDDVLFLFYDFETTQETNLSENPTEHILIVVSLQQFCMACEMQADIDTDCERCGRRRHSFYEVPVADLLSYLCKLQPWCNEVVAIEHNAKAFDSQFILKRAILLKWNPQIILSGLKIISMQMQHLDFLDSISYLPMPSRKLPEAFGLSPSKSRYQHYFITKANLDFFGPIPDIGYFGADEVREGERMDFISGNDEQKDKVFDKRRVLEQYCQDNVTVL